MKRPHPQIDHSRDTNMDSAMTPMIDVVFLLLVFFVWTASFQIVEQILPSEMSAQMGEAPSDLNDPPPEMDFEPIVIRIDWDGANPSWKLNDGGIESVQQLGERLKVLAGIKTDAPVILHPEQVVPLGYVIEAYDVSKLSGFNKVSFAVNPQSGQAQ